jgi:hypothetical protein
MGWPITSFLVRVDYTPACKSLSVTVPCSHIFAAISPIDTITINRYRYRAMMKRTTESLRQKELKETLARAENELKHTLERVQNLRDLIAVTRKLCGKPPALPETSATVTVIQRRRTKTAELANQVADVLRTAGHAMHVKDIVAKLEDRGQAVTAQNPKAAVAVALSRRPDQFQKVSGNTFDLAKKEGSAAQTA